MFTREKNNYFKVDKQEKNTDELYLYDIKRIKKIGRYKLSYRVGITEQNGEIKRELEVSVNLYRMMNTEATISYPGQGAFYWMIDLDGGTRIIGADNSERNIKIKKDNKSELISVDIKNRYYGLVNHTVEFDNKEKSVDTAYYPIEDNGAVFGIAVSIVREFITGKIESTVIQLTAMFLMIMFAIIMGFYITVVNEKKMTKAAEGAQKRAQEMAEYRRALIEHGAVGIIICTKSGEITEASRRVFELLGYNSEELNGKNINILKSGDVKEEEFIIKFYNFKDNEKRSFEIKLKHKSGKESWCVVYGSKIMYGENQEKIIWTILDITERKNYEEQIVIEKNRAEAASKVKSQFLANMSHEIKTPMNAIIGFSELLQSITDNIKAKEYIKGIKRAGQNLTTIINDILDLSKIEAGKMEAKPVETNIYAMMDELKFMFDIRAREEGINFKTVILREVPAVLILDAVRIRQIMINLIGNAVKFTSEGEVSVVIKQDRGDNEDFIERVIFEVSDTGIGIDPQFIDDIFEPFKQQDWQDTRKYGGTGLGMTIASKMSKLMGGKIEVNSIKGRGSKFRLILENVKIVSKNIDEDTNIEQSEQIKDEFWIGCFDEKTTEYLKKRFYNQWKDISKLLINSDIEEFSKQLHEVSEEIKSEKLKKYADTLYGYCSSYDVVNMNKLFMKFEKMLSVKRGE